MTIAELNSKLGFQIINQGEKDREVLSPFCCDLLSIAMSKMKAGAVWVTIMGNMNTLAVASLTEAACIVLAEGVKLELPAIEKAKQEGITVFATDLPIFEAAQKVFELIHA